MFKYSSFSSTSKYMVNFQTLKLLLKKFTFFFVQHRNESKKHKFDDKIFKKSDFYKSKKLLKIDEIDVDISFKKESYGTNKLIKYFISYNDIKLV